MGENYDSTWLYDPSVVYNYDSMREERSGVDAQQSLLEMYGTYGRGGRLSAEPSGSVIHPYPPKKKISYDQHARPIVSMMTKKEEKNVNDSDRNEIDEAVREALAKPRREAEIAKRVAAVEAIGTEDTYENGTVLKWDRKSQPTSKSSVYAYVAIKIDDDYWFVTGTVTVKSGGYKWAELVEWMTTGLTLVENLQVAASWDTIL